ncbi:uncharacterized protein LOC128251754 [Drosophila gunungcola]|uniref:THAP-type domain-containing protein n=1 Tax=Drosophila gunungcola TaxID=103775 RepID=A0A9Q0BWJ5_9MUSC|nr:uncharacterized protein LOC128251754 [Drosophila gunungcola]KAI8046475.1 hypothetical protein M5D96_002685 [Drosophila gunungcola]
MVTRTCAYKDCEFYYAVHDVAANKERTLFAFPKQPERARKWRENGRVHPKIPQNQLFMCSIHFDRKFISSSKQRTLLVGEALPYPYEERDPEPKQEVQEVASTSQENYYINLIDDELSININTVDTTTNSKPFDQELELDIEPPPAKRSKESNAPSPKDTPKVNLASMEPESSETIDSSEVSVFNFKGQEYVQMSMEYYVNEKRKMAEQLKNYKNALRSIKAQVTELDL